MSNKNTENNKRDNMVIPHLNTTLIKLNEFVTVGCLRQTKHPIKGVEMGGGVC